MGSMADLVARTKQGKVAFRVQETRNGFVVVDAAGQVASREFILEASAVGAMTRLIRDKDLKTRPCICCRRDFRSEGPHNRMCDPCRNDRREGAQPVRPYVMRGV